ncbi:hypothetical protein MW887_010076 [Aspergillus wentii]|nr:hypothetical protein MW887_010076 [Aspergillus wentii]
MFQSIPRQEPFISVTRTQDDRGLLPGYGLPLDYAPMEKNIYGVHNRSLFPSALDDRDIQKGYADLYNRYIFLPGVADSWKDEAIKCDVDITPNMADWIIDELQFKAIVYEHTQSISLYNGDITKSDLNVPESFRLEIKEAIKELEDVPPELQFFNPGTNYKQRDLVPIGFCPLVYGRSRILKDKTIGLDDALQHAGQGLVIPCPPETGFTREDMAWRVASRADIAVRPYSRNFQILPCDLRLGEDERWHISSYINNLHPVKHRNIYNLIEQLFNHLIPQWNSTLTPLKDMLHSRARIEYKKAEYHPLPKDVEERTPKPREGEAQNEFEDRLLAWRLQNWKAVQPDAGKFLPWAVPPWMVSNLPPDLPTPVRIEQGVELNKDYAERGLQLIIRILSAELTPDDPIFETDWHVEGQLNEHICASAFYTFDTENIEDITMEFRHLAELDSITEIEHDPDDSVWLKQVFGLDAGDSPNQIVGKIKCKSGRVVMYPSTVQHRINRFNLADKGKAGYTKAIAMFLVDPNIRIISTSNIPPQRLDWAFDDCKKDELDGLNSSLDRLSMNFQDRRENLPFSMNEAKQYHAQIFKELIEFTKYQHVAFTSNVITL